MTPELVEIAARALCASHAHDPDNELPSRRQVIDNNGIPTIVGSHSGPQWQIFRSDAEAVIEAIVPIIESALLRDALERCDDMSPHNAEAVIKWVARERGLLEGEE